MCGRIAPHSHCYRNVQGTGDSSFTVHKLNQGGAAPTWVELHDWPLSPAAGFHASYSGPSLSLVGRRTPNLFARIRTQYAVHARVNTRGPSRHFACASFPFLAAAKSSLSSSATRAYPRFPTSVQLYTESALAELETS